MIPYLLPPFHMSSGPLIINVEESQVGAVCHLVDLTVVELVAHYAMHLRVETWAQNIITLVTQLRTFVTQIFQP